MLCWEAGSWIWSLAGLDLQEKDPPEFDHWAAPRPEEELILTTRYPMTRWPETSGLIGPSYHIGRETVRHRAIPLMGRIMFLAAHQVSTLRCSEAAPRQPIRTVKEANASHYDAGRLNRLVSFHCSSVSSSRLSPSRMDCLVC
jgi:hypothetical protein